MAEWERQKGEKEKEWAAFQLYISQDPPRNKIAVARELGIGSTWLYRLARVWQWDARCTAWDNRLQEHRDEVVLDELESVTREHLRAARMMRDLGVRTVERVLEASEGGDVAPTEIREALALIKEAVSTERLILGEATERTETTERWDLSGLSADEIRELRRLKGLAARDRGLSE